MRLQKTQEKLGPVMRRSGRLSPGRHASEAQKLRFA